MSEAATDTPARTARHLLRGCDRAVLATSLQGWPYASLVLVAVDHDGSPLLLISDLAEHSKNLKRDQRASLLFDGTPGLDDPLTGARVTVLGDIVREEEARLLARFTARHPSAQFYAGFKDFHLYRMKTARAHLVAGFGRIDWIDAAALLYADAGGADLAAAEADILAHMNTDHAATIDLYAAKLAGLTGEGWRLTGVDPEGADLRRAGAVARLDFPKPVSTPEGVRMAFTALAQAARNG
jgi:heme iron utilization protein